MEYLNSFEELGCNQLFDIEGGSWNGWGAIAGGVALVGAAIFTTITAPATIPALTVACVLTASAAGGAAAGLGASEVCGYIEF